jgi:drug/metabolite transporter (DMT)-like permease
MAAVLALMSSLVWGTADFLGGTLSRRRHPVAVLGGSQPFGLITALVAAVALGQLQWGGPAMSNGIVAGLFGLFGLICFYTALATGRMGIVSPISSLGVVIPLAIGLLAGDQPRPMQMLGVVVAIIGVVLASGPELSGGAPIRPVVLSLLAALFFGAGVYFMAAGGKANPAMTVVMMRVTQVGLLLALALALRTVGGLARSDIPLLGLTGFLDASANVLYTSAAAIGLLSLVSVLGSLFPVVTVLLAWWVHRERLQPVQYAGIAFTVMGVAAITAG